MKLLRHLAGYLPVNIASGLAAFGGVYVFTRLLGAEEYGAYALMFWAMSVIHTLSLTAVEAANYRFAASAEAAGTGPAHYAAALSLISRSVLVALTLAGLLWFLVRDVPRYAAVVPWIALLLPVDAIVKIALEAHRAGQRVGRYASTETFRLLAGFVFGALIAWQAGLGAAAPLAGLAVAGALMAARELPFLINAAKGGQTAPGTARTWLRYGLPVAAALALDTVVSGIDRPMLAWLSPQGDAAVGAYAAGYGVADKTVLLLCAWAAMAASPLMLAAYEKSGPTSAAREAGGLIRTLLLLGVPAAVGLALVARPLGEAMIGEAVRAQAIEIIPWIAFAGLLNGLLIHYFADVFPIVKKTGERALLMLVPAVTNVGLNAVLIPRFDVMGAVYATLASYAVGILVLGFAGRRHIALPLPWLDLLKIAVAALAMWPVIALLPDLGGWAELLLKALAGGAVYASLVFAFDAGGARGFIRRRASATETGA
jgi:O-antigen/teichoic acid export membrane protein